MMPSKARSKGKCKRSAAPNPPPTLTARLLGRASTNSAVRRPVPQPTSSTASSPRNRNRDNTFLPQLNCGPERRWYIEAFHSREIDGGCSAKGRFNPREKQEHFQNRFRNPRKSVELRSERASTQPPAHDLDHRRCPRHPRCPRRYAPCHP